MGFPKMRVPKMNSLFFYFYFFFSAGPFLVSASASSHAVPALGKRCYGGGRKGRRLGAVPGAPARMSARGGGGAGVIQSSPKAVAAARWVLLMENPIKMDDLLL